MYGLTAICRELAAFKRRKVCVECRWLYSWDEMLLAPEKFTEIAGVDTDGLATWRLWNVVNSAWPQGTKTMLTVATSCLQRLASL